MTVVFPTLSMYNNYVGCDVMSKWKSLLDIDRRRGDSTASNNAYSKLIWDVWMPMLRSTIRYGISSPSSLYR